MQCTYAFYKLQHQHEKLKRTCQVLTCCSTPTSGIHCFSPWESDIFIRRQEKNWMWYCLHCIWAYFPSNNDYSLILTWETLHKHWFYKIICMHALGQFCFLFFLNSTVNFGDIWLCLHSMKCQGWYLKMYSVRHTQTYTHTSIHICRES
jgi:hypothetical protein